MTEQDLIAGLVTQDRDAIQHLVTNYQDKVIKTAFYFVGNMEDAEDLSQEVFLEILRSVVKYRKNSTLNTWIYRITVNKALDHLRKQKRGNFIGLMGNMFRISHDGVKIFDKEPGSEDTGNAERERRRILDDAISSLPENQRIAFILHKYEDLAYKEISVIMNLSLSAVESHIHRAKLNLQKKLVNHFSEYVNKKRS